MPSKSPAQHRLMEAVAHDPGFAKKVGIPQSVGKDFAEADKMKTHSTHTSMDHSPGRSTPYKPEHQERDRGMAHRAKGGPVGHGKKHWIQGAIKHPGAEKNAAKKAGMSTHEYMEKHKHDSGKAGARARLGLRLEAMHH